MFPSGFLSSVRCPFFPRKKKGNRDSLETEAKELHFWNSVPFNGDPSLQNLPTFSLRSDGTRAEGCRVKKKTEMSGRVSSFSDLIQRVTASCLLHPLAADTPDIRPTLNGVRGEEEEESSLEYASSEEDDDGLNGYAEKIDKEEKSITGIWKGGKVGDIATAEMVILMNEVFDAVSAMKKAYVSMQEAHCPWDPERMRAADVAVVGELRKLGILRDRFWRSGGGGGGRKGRGQVATLREVVAPYEAAVEEAKREVKAKETEIESLKEKLKSAISLSNGGGGKKGRSLSRRKVCCSQALAAAPAPELFEATMSQVREALKSFASHLLSLMRAAHWDIAAAVRSIESATANTESGFITTTITPSVIANHHAKYALESYVSRKIFQGFDHETFYIDGSLSSLLNPDQYRRDCFTQYRDMKAMDPVELLGILPTCHFGRFCSKKYLATVHPKMEESLFGNLEQRDQVVAGNHPRSQFYGEFLGLAKAIWLLHLLAFALDPAPNQFEASRGAEFHPQYMESVVKFSGGRIPAGHVVGFAVTPGFKLGNGSIIKAGVYAVPRT
ncbi:hypothetical protein SLA2020_076910 [Shorea laevis]